MKIDDITIIGKAWRDCEIRSTRNGDMATVGIWINLKGMAMVGTELKKVKKGDTIKAQGRLSLDEYDRFDGSRTSTVSMMVQSIEVISSETPPIAKDVLPF